MSLLAANGATGKEIAAHLVLAVRTVDNHLHNIYFKLGISGRTELSAALINPVEQRADS